MPAESPSAEGAFDFGAVMDEALEGYLERPAVEREILQYLGRRPAGCCVVVGEPGSGKSALAARLIRGGHYIHHFLRKGHTEFGLWSDPHGFLTSIGFQFKERFGAELFPQTIVMDVQGEVRDVAEGASYAHAEIEQLVAVPWHSDNFRVRVDAARIRGHAAGVRIHEVIEDYRRIPLPTYRQMGLIGPLRRLRALDPDARVILWVDGLDEAIGASPSIADVLPSPPELAELGNLTLAISSRPGRHLDRFTQRESTVIDLGELRFKESNAAVVEAYVRRELADDKVRAGLARAGRPVDDIVAELVQRSQANFLYLRHVVLAARSGQMDVLVDGGLPDTLDGIYVRLIRQLVRAEDSRYPDEAHHVVSALALAYTPLTIPQLERFTGLDRPRISAVLERLAPFMDTARVDGVSIHRFYHESFRECLVDPAHEAEVWFVPAERGHARMAAAYAPEADGRLLLDTYGIEHLTDHLLHGDAASRVRLLDLVGNDWRRAKRQHHGTHRAFEADLDKAAAAARERPLPEALIETARLAMMQALVDQSNEQIAPAALELMVRLGQRQRALEYVAPHLDPDDTARRLAAIMRGLGASDPTLVRHLLRQGIETVPDTYNLGHTALADLLAACPAAGHPDIPQLLQRALEKAQKQPQYWDTPRLLAEVARLEAALDRAAAQRRFETALDAVPKLGQSSQSQLLRRLFEYWTDFDSFGAMQRVMQVTLPADHDSSEMLLAVAAAYGRTGQRAAPLEVARAVEEQLLPRMSNPYDRSRTLTAIARVQAEFGEAAVAAGTIQQALAEADALVAQPVKERRGQPATALALIADVDAGLDPTRAAATLARAWEAGAAVGEAADALVRAQYRNDPDLLAAYVDASDTREVKTVLLLAAAREMHGRDDTAAARRMDEALLLGDVPEARGWWSFLAMSVAREVDVAERGRALRLLEDYGTHEEAIVTWRIGVLTTLAARGDAQAEAWLTESLQAWIGRINPHTIWDLPSMVWQWPDALVLALDASVDRIDAPTHRLLLRAALSARLAAVAPDRSAALLERVLEDVRALPFSDRDVRPHDVMAFLAGLWWRVDRTKAERLWLRALVMVESKWGGARLEARSTVLTDTADRLMRGAPALALPLLLACGEAPPEGGRAYWVMPGPDVPDYRVAGMPKRDYLLAQLLGNEPALWIDAVGDTLADMKPEAVRSLALSLAVRRIGKGEVARRVRWSEMAAQAASAVEPHHLRCLLAADAALAFQAAGARKRAQDLALTTADEVVRSFGQPAPPGGGVSIRSAADVGYGAALGRCVTTLIEGANADAALSVLWNARHIGTTGLYMLFCALPPILRRIEPATLWRLSETQDDAMAWYRDG
jgi:hypothetical protein